MFISINPHNEKEIFSHEFISDEILFDVLTISHQSYCLWKRKSIEKRIEILPKIADSILENIDYLSDIMTQEIGKPIVQSKAELEKCIDICHHYFNFSARYLEQESIKVEAREARIIYQPLGVILGVMPWNFPFWQVFRFAIPTLMAGNSVVIKHAPNVGMCALELEKIFRIVTEEKIYSNLFIDTNQVKLVLENPLVQGVSLTGSCKAGSSVAKIAAENLKPQVLELGGSDVFVILSDADLDEAVKQCVQSRTQNNGQSCIAAKRILIEHSVYNQVIELFKNEVSALKIGNPSDTENSVGPLAREDLKDAFSSLINTGKSMGANTLLSIKNAEKSGFYVDVEILEVSDNENILFQEELFGPCFVVKKIQNLDQAISIANDSRFGLSASVWTNDLAKQKQCMEEIESGAIFINQFSKSDSRISFGGIKNSGYGRELGKDGMLAFVNKKTVVGSL